MMKIQPLLLAVVLLVCSTCSILSAESPAKISATKKEAKVLRVFISWPGSNNPPFCTWNKETKTFDGYDPEIIRLILDDQKLKYKFVYPEVDVTNPKIEVLTRDLADISLQSLSITKERKKIIDFSVPYFSDGISVMVRKTSKLKKLSELKDVKLLAFNNTTSYEYAIKHNLSNHLVSTIDQKYGNAPYLTLSEFVNDAFIFDKSYLDWVAKKNKKLVVWDKRFTEENWGIGIQKGNDALRKKINQSLTKFINDGSIEKIFKKHGVGWSKPKVKAPPKKVDPKKAKTKRK